MSSLYKRYAESRPHEIKSELGRYFYFGVDKDTIEHYKRKREEMSPYISDEDLQDAINQLEIGIAKKLDEMMKNL